MLGSGCNDHHQSAPVTWTTEWQKYTYYFATDLVQTGFGLFPSARSMRLTFTRFSSR